jgi:hypothetical protein
VVEGLRSAWSVPDVAIVPGARPDAWLVRHRGPTASDDPVPVLLQLARGGIAAILCLPGHITTLTLDRAGVSGLVYRDDGMEHTSRSSELAIAAMEGGHLDPSAALDLAVHARGRKHIDVMQGVLAAYLYDAIGDLDSIRRTAYFLIRRGHSIPYDIALLGQLDCERDGGARIPRVDARTPLTDLERMHPWTWNGTPPTTGRVAGAWPWLRQGWAYLDDLADDGAGLVDPVLLEVRDHLRPSRFTTLDATGAALLGAWLGLQPELDRG